jgi:hypothetical protein
VKGKKSKFEGKERGCVAWSDVPPSEDLVNICKIDRAFADKGSVEVDGGAEILEALPTLKDKLSIYVIISEVLLTRWHKIEEEYQDA